MKDFAALRREAKRDPVKFFDDLREAARQRDQIFELECPGREVVALLGKCYPLQIVARARSIKALAAQIVNQAEAKLLTKDRA